MVARFAVEQDSTSAGLMSAKTMASMRTLLAATNFLTGYSLAASWIALSWAAQPGMSWARNMSKNLARAAQR
jgi:hypothetical protein